MRSPENGPRVRGAEAGALHGPDSVRLWLRQCATGPFYCPKIDALHRPRFFRQPRTPGAGAIRRGLRYRHEVGHHVQICSAIPIVCRRRAVGVSDLSTIGSVRLELQADFLAGVWRVMPTGSSMWLEAGDIEEQSARQRGWDDRLQYRSRGHVVPDSFTHARRNNASAVPPGIRDRRCQPGRYVHNAREL